MPDIVSLVVDGVEVTMPAGSVVAAAIMKSGASSFRRSVRGEARGALCGVVICF